MKKSIIILAICTCFAGTVLISCKPATKEEIESKEKVETAKDKLEDAIEDLTVERREAFEAEYAAFKFSGDSIIKINDLRIEKLKRKMKNNGKSIDAQYQKNVDLMEQRNKELKIKMDTFKNDINSDWKSFKREFTNDTIPNS